MSLALNLPSHLELRRAVPGAGRTAAGYDRLRRREVAVKWATGASSLRSLRREWLLLHDLVRPGFPEPVEFGYTADEVAWMTTYWFDADPIDSLGDRCDSSGALELTRAVLANLASLHRSGLAHGDLNPHNILVCRRTGGWEVKLVDLEFAADLDRLSAGFMITDQGPDGKRAEGAAWTPRDDLRALGLILRKLAADAGLWQQADSPLHSFADRLCDDYHLQAYGDALDALYDLERLAVGAGMAPASLDPPPGPATVIPRDAAVRAWKGIRDGWHGKGQTVLLWISGHAGIGKTTFLRRQLSELAVEGHLVLDLTRDPALVEGWRDARSLLRERLTRLEVAPALMLAASDISRLYEDLVEMMPDGALVVAVTNGTAKCKEAQVPAHWRAEDWAFPLPTAREWHRWIAASV